MKQDLLIKYISQVANQLQVARAKVQEEKPVFAIVEPVVVPQQASSQGVKAYILLFIFLAVVFTITWKLLGEKIWSNLNSEEKAK